MSDAPKTHPRYESLRIRDSIVTGVERGVTSPHGLIAHGRGEAYDYLLGEKTHDFARAAIDAAAHAMSRASRFQAWRTYIRMPFSARWPA